MRVRDAMAALDGAIARHRVPVLVAWVVVVVAAVPFVLKQGDELTGGGFEVPGSQSAEVERILQEEARPTQRQVVISAVLVRDRHAAPGALARAVADLKRASDAVPGVRLRANPDDALSLARDQPPGRPTVLPFVVTASEYTAPDVATDLREQLGLADGYHQDGVSMYLVGQGALWAGMVDLTKDDLAAAEKVGFPIVLLILLLVFGSITAALLPLALGVAAVGITGAVIYALSTATIMNVYTTNMASMIGIGVAVDYSLFVVVRYREELRAGRSPDDARRTAMTTSGVAIVFSGLTVIVALASLFLIDTAALRSLAGAAIVVVAVAMLLTATLLPALLGLLGRRISPEPERRTHGATCSSTGSTGAAPVASGTSGAWWARWTARVMARPRLALAASTLVLLALAAPALALRLGDGALRQFPPGNETRVGFEKAIAVLGPGEGAPIKVLVSRADAQRVGRIVEADPEVRAVAGKGPTRDGKRLIIVAVPRHDPDSEPAKALAQRLRAQLGPGVLVGGNSAAQSDFDDEVLGSLWMVVVAILLLSFVVLTALLRSVVLPLKAILTNLLSVAAAFGVLTIVYVWGPFWDEPGYVDTFTVPLIVAAVFGLSMDYEVFLLSRIRERYEATGDTKRAVGEALGASARTITGAAAIMVAVFGVFIGTGVPAIQQVGLGCAIAIALDATLVRLVLVPAAMVVLGRWNWWWPHRGTARAVTVGTLLVVAPALVGCGGGDSSDTTTDRGGPAPRTTTAERSDGPVSVAGVTVAVDPARAGTPAHPQPVRLDMTLRLRSRPGIEPPTTKTATLILPSETAVDGGAVPPCELEVLRRRGPSACPKESLMGLGSVRGMADTSPARGDVVVVNGGDAGVWLLTTLSNPIRAQDVVRGTFEHLGGDGGTRLTLTIPESLQVVAGVPIAMRELRLNAGRGAWLTTTGCPDDGAWPYAGDARFSDGSTASYADAVPCS